MRTKGRGWSLALAVAFAIPTAVLDDNVSTAADFVKCNQITCTEACDRSAPATGYCRESWSHTVQITTLECCCCVSTANRVAANHKFYPF